MKKLLFIGVGVIFLSAGSSHPEKKSEVLLLQKAMPAIDSLYQATKKLEASTLKLDKIVTKIQ